MIIIGCPYTNMSGLHRALRDVDAKAVVVSGDQLQALGGEYMLVTGFPNPVPLGVIRVSFLRYPYDIIPPHSRTFTLREQTEAYKSLAIALDDVAVNPLSATWLLRNRSFSLREVKRRGAPVPEYRILWARAPQSSTRAVASDLTLSGNLVLKATGNCFVDETLEYDNDIPLSWLRREEDDGEVAWIMPATRVAPRQLQEYLRAARVAFVQEFVEARDEFRIYCIGGSLLTFQRVRPEVDLRSSDRADVYVDRSIDALEPVEMPAAISDTVAGALRRLGADYHLGFLCADVIVDPNGISWVIDVNPYGSLPSFDEHPAPTRALAQLILDRA